MKKLRILFFILLIALFSAANVFADVPNEPIIQEKTDNTVYWVIALAVVLIAIAVAAWILIRAKRRK